MNNSIKWEEERGLRRSHYGLMFLVVLFTTSVGFVAADPAKLGPIDGEGLAATDLDRVKIGDAAPDFTLESEKGHPVTLSQFRGKKNVILVFYRGHW